MLGCVLQVVPKGLFQSLLSSPNPLKALAPGDGLPALISAMTAAELLLHSHRCASADFQMHFMKPACLPMHNVSSPKMRWKLSGEYYNHGEVDSERLPKRPMSLNWHPACL